MIEIPVLDANGKKVSSEELDPAVLGGRVRYGLLKQAVVAYRAASRQGTVATKSRGMVHGSSRKIFRQKGTGRARAGNIRTPVRVGGGHAFAKVNRDFSQKMNRKMRRLARNSAILAKAQSGTAVILSELKFDAPATAKLAKQMKAADATGSTLVAVSAPDENLLKSGRNLPDFSVKLVHDLNAYDVLRARKLVLTPEAFKALVSDPVKAGHGTEA